MNNSLKFPDTPYDGQIVLDTQNIAWRWNGKGWIRQSSTCVSKASKSKVVSSITELLNLPSPAIGDTYVVNNNANPSDPDNGKIFTNISGTNGNTNDWKQLGSSGGGGIDASIPGIYYSDGKTAEFTQLIQAGTF